MDMPKGLLVILGLLSLGMCWDVAIITQGGAGLWIGLLLLIGRIAAIGGILVRSRTGWMFAVGFFVAIIALNLAAGPIQGLGSLLRVLIPAGCLVYLFFMRGEFD